ncbi:MAG: ribosome-associated translation inhibitor RaiA [Planctomycetota bacterium]|nr:ribosome-associated translation inhibitor RaiA [Planctomycetota bacterium]
MVITISAKHMNLSDLVAASIRRKVGRLTKYFNKVRQFAVVVERLRRGYHVEIHSDVERHSEFIGSCDHKDLVACIDLAVDRTARQLTDHKSRVRRRRP